MYFLVCESDPHLLTAVASCDEAEILAEQAAVPQLQLRPTAEIVSPSVIPFKSYDTSSHRIVTIFGQKLEDN